MRVHLWEHWLWSQRAGCAQLARQPRLCALYCGLTLTWELSFPLCLLNWRLALLYLAGGFVFDSTTDRILGIAYFRYFGLTYLSFLPWIVSHLAAGS